MLLYIARLRVFPYRANRENNHGSAMPGLSEGKMISTILMICLGVWLIWLARPRRDLIFGMGAFERGFSIAIGVAWIVAAIVIAGHS